MKACIYLPNLGYNSRMDTYMDKLYLSYTKDISN